MAFPGISPADGVDGRYDVVVIGAGPAGEAAAGLAAHRISAGRRAQP